MQHATPRRLREFNGANVQHPPAHARALYRHHIMQSLPTQHIYPEPIGYESAIPEPGHEVDAAGTFTG